MTENNETKMDVDKNTDELEFMDVDLNSPPTSGSQAFVFVDIQGFKTSRNRFMVKEFCLIDGDFVYHALIKSTQPLESMSNFYQRQANWLIREYHGIRFEIGDIHVNELKKLYPRLQNKTVFVKGMQKITWMQYIFRDCGEIKCENIEDIEDIDYSENYSNSFETCDYHRKIRMQPLPFTYPYGACAKARALMLQNLVSKLE